MTEQYRIQEIKKAGDQCRVDIAPLDEPITVSAETVYRHRLAENTIITPSQLEQLTDEADAFACDREAVRLMSVRQHATAELRKKLKRRGYREKNINTAISRLQRQGALDDAHLAHRMSENLVRQRPCGRSYLVSYLRRKHIDRGLAESTADVVLGHQDETEMAVASLRQRWNRFREFELETARSRAYNYLARRGFGYAASKAAFERLINSEHEGNDHYNG